MKKARSNFECQAMYVHNYTRSNTHKKYHRIHHTPGHNQSIEKNNQILSEKALAEELDDNNNKRLQKVVGGSCIILEQYSHIPHNVNGTKPTDGGT